MTHRKIFLLGNCQVRTLADVLRMVFPEDEVIEIFTWDFADEENTAGATQYLRSFDVQIRMRESHCTLTTRHIDSLPHQRKIDIPSITFPVGFGVLADEVGATLRGYINREHGSLESSNFILRSDGTIEVAIYSSGSVGRLLPEDALDIVLKRRERWIA
jgi:hypothetical protein